MPRDYLTLVPAYGRDYQSAKAVKADWYAGKDFQIATIGPDDGRYMNKQDARPGDVLNIRYCRLTRILVIRI